MSGGAPILRGACVGAGYFSHFHRDAWRRVAGVEITAVCDVDAGRAEAAAAEFEGAAAFTDLGKMLDAVAPDFVDVITPPPTHLEICAEIAARGIAIICQKPLAPTAEEARALVADASRAGVRFMVHENFRFQPWHREIHRLIDAGAVGRLHTLAFHTRMGDGWGEDAYLSRQPYFRDYPRLLVNETGIHVIDTFRYLGGEIGRVAAWLRRLNPVIRGEDCGLLVFEFADGAVGTWDANRFNEPPAGVDPRYTFGALLVEGDGGSLRLDPDGTLTYQPIGRAPGTIDYAHRREGFAGDCVHATQQHFIDRLRDGAPFETGGEDYLRNIAVQEAVYASAESGQPVAVPAP